MCNMIRKLQMANQKYNLIYIYSLRLTIHYIILWYYNFKINIESLYFNKYVTNYNIFIKTKEILYKIYNLIKVI